MTIIAPTIEHFTGLWRQYTCGAIQDDDVDDESHPGYAQQREGCLRTPISNGANAALRLQCESTAATSLDSHVRRTRYSASLMKESDFCNHACAVQDPMALGNLSLADVKVVWTMMPYVKIDQIVSGRMALALSLAIELHLIDNPEDLYAHKLMQ